MALCIQGDGRGHRAPPSAARHRTTHSNARRKTKRKKEASSRVFSSKSRLLQAHDTNSRLMLCQLLPAHEDYLSFHERKQ